MKSSTPIWLFDLDNTLHNASAAVFPAIAANMVRYMTEVLEQAGAASDLASVNALRLDYLRRYGATLKGMVLHHGVREADFLREAHRFVHLASLLRLERGLGRVLARLPGQKILLTNAPAEYANGVIRHLGLRPHFAQQFSIESMRVHGRSQPKPSKTFLRQLLAQHGWHPRRCILVEDSVANIRAAKQVGLRTVMVTGFGQHQPQKSLTASADITVKSVFELTRRFRQFSFHHS